MEKSSGMLYAPIPTGVVTQFKKGFLEFKSNSVQALSKRQLPWNYEREIARNEKFIIEISDFFSVENTLELLIQHNNPIEKVGETIKSHESVWSSPQWIIYLQKRASRFEIPLPPEVFTRREVILNKLLDDLHIPQNINAPLEDRIKVLADQLHLLDEDKVRLVTNMKEGEQKIVYDIPIEFLDTKEVAQQMITSSLAFHLSYNHKIDDSLYAKDPTEAINHFVDQKVQYLSKYNIPKKYLEEIQKYLIAHSHRRMAVGMLRLLVEHPLSFYVDQKATPLMNKMLGREGVTKLEEAIEFRLRCRRLEALAHTIIDDEQIYSSFHPSVLWKNTIQTMRDEIQNVYKFAKIHEFDHEDLYILQKFYKSTQSYDRGTF